MRIVQWIDEAGGWHTGAIVPDAVHREDVSSFGTDPRRRVLVKESCDGVLSWVPLFCLKQRPMREEFE